MVPHQNKTIDENPKPEIICRNVSSLSFLHVNVRSLKKNSIRLEALVYSFESPPSVICLSETWLQKQDDPRCFSLKGYKHVSSKSRDSRAGGVMIQTREDISFIREIESDLEESTIVQLKNQEYLFFVMVCYNPPRSNKMSFLEKFDACLEKLSNIFTVVFCGDINIDTLSFNKFSSDYLNIIESNGFDFLVNKPTRVIQESSTCLDHFITQNITD